MARWWLIGGGAALGALLIASIALALTNRPTEFAPGTPEAAVQALLHAANVDEFETAYGMLAQSLREECPLRHFAEMNSMYGYGYGGGVPDIEARLHSSRIVGEDAFVVVDVTEYYGTGIYGSGESSRNERYSLQRENGDWKFTNYPWPYSYCDRWELPGVPSPTPTPTSTPIPVQ